MGHVVFFFFFTRLPNSSGKGLNPEEVYLLHRCVVALKCLLWPWKGLWTNECELLATPAYKRCICVRQWKGPANVMGEGASACGMWCLGERAGAEQMKSVYLANQSCCSPTGKFTQALKCKCSLFFQRLAFIGGYTVFRVKNVDHSPVFCLPVFYLYVTTPSFPSVSLFFYLCKLSWLMLGGVVLPEGLFFSGLCCGHGE